jgi:hypothetical protein
VSAVDNGGKDAAAAAPNAPVVAPAHPDPLASEERIERYTGRNVGPRLARSRQQLIGKSDDFFARPRELPRTRSCWRGLRQPVQ